MEDLAVRLVSPDANLRLQSAKHVWQHPTIAQLVVVPLVRATGHADESSRFAEAALECIGAPQCEDAGALAELLHDDSPRVASWAATLLGRLGEASAPMATNLGAVISNGAEMHVKQQAAWALSQMGPAAESASDALNQATESGNLRLARIARRALRRIQAA
ncbi:MAG: HEAT repeat domain-containing protein [Planctomycetota bacterium]